ncbi:MAG: MFS transporter [Anaerolineae bacterium]|jgi:DHA3 family macrolide efflux protein-like MFS transporter|nr:MFS transporter [Anaerolineae bacterium]
MNETKQAQSSVPTSMRPFFTVWTGQAFSLLGSELVQFALVWWITTTTGSATALALASMMAVLPRVFVSPVAGALVDRWNRRTVMMLADGLSALAVIVLATLFALDATQVWHVYALMLIRAACGAFHWPAMQASTTLMVPEEHLARVAGLNQALQGMGTIVGPPLGALLLAILPMQGILFVDVATALLAIGTLVCIHVPQPLRSGAATKASHPSLLVDLREALRFLRRRAGILMVIAIGALVNFLIFPALSLQPLLVTDHFGGDVQQLAWLQSAFGVGMVTGGITLSVWGGFRRRSVTGLLALALSGVGFVLIGIAPPSAFPMAVGAMFFAWFMNPIANGSLFAVLQTIVPADMQGRVFTLLQAASGAMIPLGLGFAGPLADVLGVQIWFLLAGSATALMGVVALFVPAIARLDDMPGHESTDCVRLDDPGAVSASA